MPPAWLVVSWLNCIQTKPSAVLMRIASPSRDATSSAAAGIAVPIPT